MLHPSTLVQQHAGAIIGALVETLASPDGRARLEAAKLLLLWGWGPPLGKRRGASELAAVESGDDLKAAEQQRLLDRLMPHLRPAAKAPNRSATPCPARHADGPSRGETMPLRADRVSEPISPEPDAASKNTPIADPVLTPCPAAEPVVPASPNPAQPSINPMSRENRPSPLAAPPSTESPRGDADPMSRRLLLSSHRAEDAFRRRLPQPPDIEPPWPFQHEGFGQPYRRRRWR